MGADLVKGVVDKEEEGAVEGYVEEGGHQPGMVMILLL